MSGSQWRIDLAQQLSLYCNGGVARIVAWSMLRTNSISLKHVNIKERQP